MASTARYTALIRSFRYDLALVIICTAVFVPKVIRDYEPTKIFFGDIPYYIFTTQSMVKDGDLDLKNQLANDPQRLRDSIGFGKNGEWYSTHPILMPVVAIPFYIFAGNPGFLIFNIMIIVGLVVLMFRLARLFAPEWAAFASALVFAFGTQTSVTVYNFSPDAFSTFVTLIAILLLIRDQHLASGIFWGLAILSRTPNLIPYFAAFVFLLADKRRFQATFKFLVGSVPFMGFFLLLNKIQYDGFFTLGYTRVLALTENGKLALGSVAGHFGFEYAPAGLWGQLVDVDHGLLFTNAVALIGVLGFFGLFKESWKSALYILLVAFSNYVFHAFFKLWAVSGVGTNRYLFTTILLMAVPFAVLLGRVLKRNVLAGKGE